MYSKHICFLRANLYLFIEVLVTYICYWQASRFLNRKTNCINARLPNMYRQHNLKVRIDFHAKLPP